MNGYGNVSEANRRTDAWRMGALHDSGEGLGTHLADRRGRSGRKDRAVRPEIRISSEALSKGIVRDFRQMATAAAEVNPPGGRRPPPPLDCPSVRLQNCVGQIKNCTVFPQSAAARCARVLLDSSLIDKSRCGHFSEAKIWVERRP